MSQSSVATVPLPALITSDNDTSLVFKIHRPARHNFRDKGHREMAQVSYTKQRMQNSSLMCNKPHCMTLHKHLHTCRNQISPIAWTKVFVKIYMCGHVCVRAIVCALATSSDGPAHCRTCPNHMKHDTKIQNFATPKIVVYAK